jgi:hypothetical protein
MSDVHGLANIFADIPSDQPVLVPVKGTDLWQFARDMIVTFPGGQHTVPAGFKTDGASIPRFFWRVIGHPMTSKYAKAAGVHDYLYVYHPAGSSKAHADQVFFHVLIDEGVPEWRAKIMYRAVEWFGGGAYRRRSELGLRKHV